MMKTDHMVFGGHQTFSFRHGWLEKGFRGIDETDDLFGAEDDQPNI